MALTFEHFRQGEPVTGQPSNGVTMEHFRQGEPHGVIAPPVSTFQAAWAGPASHVVGVSNA